MRAAAVAAALGLIVVAGVTTAAPAQAVGAVVTVSPGTADPEYATRLSLRGSGFQSVPNGFGGVYVLFGVVEGAWRPSEGGQSGVGYAYVQDSESVDNNGYQRFVAFPGDPTAAAANGGSLAADGTWAADLVIPGATFQVAGRDGAVRTVDCLTARCGVITIGAHGVVNPTNETFTPVSFSVPAAAAVTPSPAPTTAASSPVPVPPTGTTPTSPTTAAPSTTSSATSTPSPGRSQVSARPAASRTQRPAGSAAGPWLVGGAVLLAALGVPTVVLARRRRPSSEEKPS